MTFKSISRVERKLESLQNIYVIQMYIIPGWTGQSRRQEITLRVKISRERRISYFARRFVSEKENLEICHTRTLDSTKRVQPGFS